MNQVYKEVIEKTPNGDNTYGTASPDEIKQLMQGHTSTEKSIALVATDAMSDKICRVLAHCEEYLRGIPGKTPQPLQMQADNGYTPPLQMH